MAFNEEHDTRVIPPTVLTNKSVIQRFLSLFYHTRSRCLFLNYGSEALYIAKEGVRSLIVTVLIKGSEVEYSTV